MTPDIKAFFDEATNTVSYIVSDPETKNTVIIDSVLDYDPNSGRTSTRSADQIANYVHDNNLIVLWVLETHAHADHLSAAPYLREKLGGRIGTGEHIKAVQKVFFSVFDMQQKDIEMASARFDYLFKDRDIYFRQFSCRSSAHSWPYPRVYYICYWRRSFCW